MIGWLRFLYAFLAPVAGCAVLRWEGVRWGIWGGLGIAVGIFIYHYLLAALFKTDRKVFAGSPAELAWLAGSACLIGFLNEWNWKSWLIEQALLEAGAFGAGIAVLAIVKGFREGVKHAPWFLILLVFVAPPGLLVFHSVSVLLQRHSGTGGGLSWIVLAGAFVLSAIGAYRTMHPFASGDRQLAEPLEKGWQIVLTVIWLIALLAGAVTMAVN